MHQVHDRIERVAVSSLSVLILGETGSGKELVAEQVHRRSPRASRPFVSVNCAAITESLVDSELFGHERGAFTGAHASKVGFFAAADGGTLFLDEIGEMPLPIQAKLLRVLESGEVRRVGSTEPQRVDVRVIAATHRDLGQLVAQGHFRQDLYFRLRGVTIRVPPLRERAAEIPSLARTFAIGAAGRLGRQPPVLAASALAALCAHDWPGNVRELRNVIECAVVLCRGDVLEDIDLDLPRAPAGPTLDGPGANPAASVRDQVRGFERERVVAALRQADGNQTVAAGLLGISRRTLTNKLNAYGLERPRKGREAHVAAGGSVHDITQLSTSAVATARRSA